MTYHHHIQESKLSCLASRYQTCNYHQAGWRAAGPNIISRSQTKKTLRIFFIWLGLADTLRTTIIDFDKNKLAPVKELLDFKVIQV